MASPALYAIIAAKRANPFTPDKSIEQLRLEYSATISVEAIPKGTIITEVDAGGEMAEWTRAPGASADRVFLFIHGGGYIRGAAPANRATAALISAATGATTISIGYRLAPEHPFPAAINDVYDAIRTLGIGTHYLDIAIEHHVSVNDRNVDIGALKGGCRRHGDHIRCHDLPRHHMICQDLGQKAAGIG